MKREGKTMKKRKRKINTEHENEEIIFPLILSSLFSKSRTSETLIMKCLNKLLLLFLPHVDSSPILSLIPSLLNSNCSEIVCKSAEIIGAASLSSFEVNEKIALEDEVVKGLIPLLKSSKREIAVASCNAVLDLSTTLVGRTRLLECGAIENLILCFVQEFRSSSLYPDMKFSEEDEYPILLLHCAIALINSCTIEHLQHIPIDLSIKLSALLKKLWRQAHKNSLSGTSSTLHHGVELLISNIKPNNLAESIFRLSINHIPHPETTEFDNIKKSIGSKPFLSEIWETSPLLIRNASTASFSHFTQYLGLKEEATMPSCLPLFLNRFISCPPILSDELNILQVIKDIKNHLGHPLIYHQDIRVVKTEQGEKESHYSDLSKCDEAFKEGYSIALRGIEFRHPTIGAISDELASIFGQPSGGVNMYITPSNLQGLARHSDDHCVFVCQVIGGKRWRVFPGPMDFRLPRLYEAFDCLEKESHELDECQEFVLREGDVLYIPRGSPHEAVADVDGFSLHLTLAVEIEPPFEWEGFMHVAVYSWAKKHNANYQSGDSVACSLHMSSVMLLHIAIKVIGDRDLRFRKACLVGSIPFSSETREWLCEDQKITFSHLISKIMSESMFSDAFKHLESALEMNEDPIEHLRWLKCIALEEDIERSDCRDVYDVLSRDRNTAEEAFMRVMLEFCREVEFEYVKQGYQVVLEMYRKVRKQYTNSMLSLHSALCGDEHESRSNV